MSTIVGVDLGTCNSCIAAAVGRKVRAMADEGRTTIPSVFAMSDGREIMGFPAKMQIVSNPYQTIHGIKRVLGRPFHSPEVQHMRESVSYEVFRGKDGEVRVRAEHLELTPVEICGRILAHMKNVAERNLGHPVRKAVISVPAHYDDGQRKATKEAGELAGFEVLRLLNEPTAASLAYGLRDRSKRRLAVFDLGGGTFDFTLMDVHDGIFEVRATDGDSYLGGTDFDYEIVRWLIDRFRTREGVNLAMDRTAVLRLKLAAERAKIELSEAQEAVIDLPAIATATRGGTHLNEGLRRDELEQMCRPYVDRCLEICEQTLAAAKTWVDQIDEVILVGGQTRMPLVARAVRDFFGTDPRHDLLGDEVVAIGAAVQGYALSAAMSSGEGRTAARGEQKQRASVRSRPGMLEMDADPDVLLLDVLPRTLGLEGADDTFNVVLHRNTKLPAHVRHLLTLNDPGEGPHRIRVIQGEDPRASQNTLLGELHLRNVVTDRNGRAQIEIQFRVDASGMLQLRATDLNSEDGAVITLESRLPGETTSEKA
jgi:molecular chaperone DnaK